jgi:hypothetical protein
MSTEQQAEIIESIGGILLDLLPHDAVAITASIEADEAFAGTEFFLRRPGGQTEDFGDDRAQIEPADAINLEIIKLREVMVQDTGHGFYGATITVDRDGEFKVDFSYDPPED